MTTKLKTAVAILLMVITLIGGTAYWKRTEITRLLKVQHLFDEDRIVANFTQMNAAFLYTPIARGTGPTSTLPQGNTASLPANVITWIKDRNVTSLVVLKDGNIVSEGYFLGTEKDDLRISWSIAKSWLSALVGVLLQEGAISSLDALVTDYAPSLTGSAYEGVSLRNVLNMASGVAFDEDYHDFYSDINRMGRALALGGTLDSIASRLRASIAAPGKAWKYVSIDAHVVGMVIRGATGRAIPDLMSEKIIVPLGLEKSPYYLTDSDGVAFVLGGLNLTTRDYARMGQMFLQDGYFNGQQIVPKAWVNASTTASAPTQAKELGYGYQWWVPNDTADGEFLARGFYGQYLYINQKKRVVIATTAADLNFHRDGVNDRNIAFFREIAAGV